MKTTMALSLMLMALTTQARIYSFSREVGEVLAGNNSTQFQYETEVTWVDVNIEDFPMVAILEEELDELSQSESLELIEERANAICRWTGFDAASSYKTQGEHRIFKYRNYWYDLSEQAGEWPNEEDLDLVRIAPNARYLSSSVISSMLKISTSEEVLLRNSSPLSFLRISCQR